MSDIRLFRVTARWLSALLLAGVLCPRVPVWAAPAPVDNVTRTGVVVLDCGASHIVLSTGSRDGITKGTEFRILRGSEELARVKITETSFATARATVASGAAAAQLRPNDRAEMIGSPAVRRSSSFKFPWGVLVGAGVLALVVMGIDRGTGSTSSTSDGGSTTTGGAASVRID